MEQNDKVFHPIYLTPTLWHLMQPVVEIRHMLKRLDTQLGEPASQPIMVKLMALFTVFLRYPPLCLPVTTEPRYEAGQKGLEISLEELAIHLVESVVKQDFKRRGSLRSSKVVMHRSDLPDFRLTVGLEPFDFIQNRINLPWASRFKGKVFSLSLVTEPPPKAKGAYAELDRLLFPEAAVIQSNAVQPLPDFPAPIIAASLLGGFRHEKLGDIDWRDISNWDASTPPVVPEVRPITPREFFTEALSAL